MFTSGQTICSSYVRTRDVPLAALQNNNAQLAICMTEVIPSIRKVPFSSLQLNFIIDSFGTTK